MKVLGIAAFDLDSAAALVEDGRIVAAVQEERLTRFKNEDAFPAQSIAFCLRQAGCSLAQIDKIVFYENPFGRLAGFLRSYAAAMPQGFSAFCARAPLAIGRAIRTRSRLLACLAPLAPDVDLSDRVRFVNHAYAHAASAFFASPFDEAAVLVVDGFGHRESVCAGVGKNTDLTMTQALLAPDSLGDFYAFCTGFLGFNPRSGAYKVMGLAPYGTPRFADKMKREWVRSHADGSFCLNQNVFCGFIDPALVEAAITALTGLPPRAADAPVTQDHMDFAASLQSVAEDLMLSLTRALAARTGARKLCLAGEVALNCVANGKILRDGAFDELWIQPASGDAGAALGAALAGYYYARGAVRQPVKPDAMRGAFLGPSFDDATNEQVLRDNGAVYTVLGTDALLDRTARALADGQVVGWMQGAMEFGPRALGARSILADPRDPAMQAKLNGKVKRRESFRPFAPSVLKEAASDWFDLPVDSPYMLIVADARKDGPCAIPAVTHVDGSARAQTVDAAVNPLYHALLTRFQALTGCPVIVNTSFNVRGEPIVCSPLDAYRCFLGTDIDALVIGACFLEKAAQRRD